jgi:Na+-driven multidrug efflux pump
LNLCSVVNLILDPLLIFFSPLGFVGAAAATALSETVSGSVYLRLLAKRKLANLRLILRPPSLEALMPLILGGASMLGRQMALNFGFICAARRAQAIDPTGVSAAAYGIVMQTYSIGIVCHVAMQGTTAALVPSTLAQAGLEDARKVADRMFVWCAIVGVLLGLTQFLAIPWIVPLFSTLLAVQEKVRTPSMIACLLHVVNGFVFAGEGVLLGTKQFRDLMLITTAGVGTMVACLASPMGQKLNGVLLSFLTFSAFQAIVVIYHYLKLSPLASNKTYR